ncbi:Ornithine decarboxylase, constitutive [compost metagenome]
MKVLTKIVRSASVEFHERPGITVVALQSCTRLLSASAFVLNEEDALSTDVMNCVDSWRIPLFVVLNSASVRGSSSFISVQATLLQAPLSEDHFALIQEAAMTYEMATLPPFTRAITEFTLKERPTFACPGHQGGKCLDFHPAGLRLKQLLGEKIFKVDVPHASPELGDVLNHEGPIRQAEGLAAKVFNSDETYFVLNGTSTANKIVTSALLSSGDLVLMDRNNHKSIFLGALVQGGACPVYLDNFRDDYGVLGGYKKGALEEDHLRLKASRIDEAKSREIRPFRLAIVQHATCDGVVVDAAALLNKIGHLCDYVLFDSAWLGYEPFIESLSWRSPLHLSYQEDAPGIIVTQSVHKQMSGLSQTSQIHKKDNHVRHQTRFCSSHVFNSAFMLHSSTSPFYPLFMSLEVNAAVHANGNGKLLWSEAVERAIEFREQVTACCRVIKPYYGSREPLTEIEAGIISSVYTQSYLPAHQYTALPGLSPIEIDFHYLDPCKVIFTTRRHGDIDCGSCIAIPAAIVTHFLR